MTAPVLIRFVVLAVVAGAVALVVVGGDTGDDSYRLRLTVPDAGGIVAGSAVRVAGRPVGEVLAVRPTRDGRAKLELGVDDEAAPLPAGTKAQLRFGGTINYSGRYVELIPARGGAPLAAGAALRPGDTWVPMEFDDVFAIFGPRTRQDLKRTLDAGGPGLEAAGPQIARTLDRAPGAVDQAAGLLGDLGEQRGRLQTLLRTAARVADAAHRADPGIRALVDDASTALGATAAEADPLRDAIAAAPAALVSARATLRQADGTLRDLSGVATRLRPGVAAVRRLVTPLERTLQGVTEVGPVARETLATARRSGPDLSALLRRARGDLPRLTRISKTAAKQLDCIRPYAPELAGFAATWAGFVSQGDGKDKFARVYVQSYGLPTATPLTPGQAVKSLPYLTFAYPRPAGLNAGKPWFRPACGTGPESLDPAKDLEARAFDPSSKDLLAIHDDPEFRP